MRTILKRKEDCTFFDGIREDAIHLFSFSWENSVRRDDLQNADAKWQKPPQVFLSNFFFFGSRSDELKTRTPSRDRDCNSLQLEPPSSTIGQLGKERTLIFVFQWKSFSPSSSKKEEEEEETAANNIQREFDDFYDC
jgi:hypothetical protein